MQSHKKSPQPPPTEDVLLVDAPLEGFDRRPTPPPPLLDNVPKEIYRGVPGSTAKWPPARRSTPQPRSQRRQALPAFATSWSEPQAGGTGTLSDEDAAPDSCLGETLRALAESTEAEAPERETAVAEGAGPKGAGAATSKPSSLK